jgi:DNA repair protein SbcD/Mre11
MIRDLILPRLAGRCGGRSQQQQRVISLYIGPMRGAKILHTSDTHLGVAGQGDGTALEERAFARAIDLAIEQDVDALLVAGDLFDHARVPETLLAWTAGQLDRAGRPVLLLTGNHDVLDGSSVHHRFRAPDRCTQTVLLDQPAGSIVEVPGTDIVVWGRAMVEHAPWFRPLEGVPPRPAGRWSVVAGHGLALTNDRRSDRGSPITPADIAAVDWDYVALGHVHAHMVLREPPLPVVYPGATLRSHQGMPGVVVVTFTPGTGTSFEWMALDRV